MQRLHQALKQQGKPKLQRELSAERTCLGVNHQLSFGGPGHPLMLCFVAITSLIHDNGCGCRGLSGSAGSG